MLTALGNPQPRVRQGPSSLTEHDQEGICPTEQGPIPVNRQFPRNLLPENKEAAPGQLQPRPKCWVLLPKACHQPPCSSHLTRHSPTRPGSLVYTRRSPPRGSQLEMLPWAPGHPPPCSLAQTARYLIPSSPEGAHVLQPQGVPTRPPAAWTRSPFTLAVAHLQNTPPTLQWSRPTPTGQPTHHYTHRSASPSLGLHSPPPPGSLPDILARAPRAPQHSATRPRGPGTASTTSGYLTDQQTD
ncbi:hypothetical protein P7K49_032730 [Saguinus oedipus]|uniref:Uncharacterized protein n=1 Tax=Saguinus oedipus TaxID=9490 RepID=A0ABQ9TPX4_SAGOE|nr:hypothetical protein P7K49_032730 [Saguinus oedipus]